MEMNTLLQDNKFIEPVDADQIKAYTRAYGSPVEEDASEGYFNVVYTGVRKVRRRFCHCKSYVKLRALFPIVLVTILFGQIIPATTIESYQKAYAQMLPRMFTDLPANEVIKFTSTNGYVDSIGTMHIVGELLNRGQEPAKFVKVTASLYNPSGQIVDTQLTYTDPSTIMPGMSAPFDLMILKDTFSHNTVSSAKLHVAWDDSIPQSHSYVPTLIQPPFSFPPHPTYLYNHYYYYPTYSSITRSISPFQPISPVYSPFPYYQYPYVNYYWWKPGLGQGIGLITHGNGNITISHPQ